MLSSLSPITVTFVAPPDFRRCQIKGRASRGKDLLPEMLVAVGTICILFRSQRPSNSAE